MFGSIKNMLIFVLPKQFSGGKNSQIMTQVTFTTGEKFNSFYGNGAFQAVKTISRVTASSVFTTSINGKGESFGEQRESINTCRNYISVGTWKKI